MRLLKLLERSSITAIKLPVAMAWDVVSLGNMGEESSTEKVLEDHRKMKREDEE